jgi:coenzyme F420-reducing hydrogenase alpha subunit
MSPVGTCVLERASFDALFDALGRRGYTVVGPTVREQAIVYFVVDVGSERGAEVLGELPHAEAHPREQGAAEAAHARARSTPRHLRFVEEHVEHSNALHGRLRERGSYLTGPLARFNLASGALRPLAAEAAREAGLGSVCRNPFQSIVVRSAELVQACDEALAIIDGYDEPDAPAVDVVPRRAVGHGATEPPRGLLYQRYEIDEDGTILDARIVPPTSQNQRSIEEDLRTVVERHVDLPDDQLALRCEQAIRNHDPCISCATHFLDLTVERA